ncbi:MAG: hypothetical protein IIA02_07035 [Proteobacteria bacterium]|uniref:hypothetical protein n=1 Tax=Aquabacterium sp. TaxID=1872578 RepID=UPI0035C683BA|nr:hypothetical protein [Pseudomonadota bacterium]
MPHLQYLTFDASLDTDGCHTFDAQASTDTAEGHAAVLDEARQVLAWAAAQFPDGPGALDEGCSWCHDQQFSDEGRWQTVSLSISGTADFAAAFERAFASAIGQGAD